MALTATSAWAQTPDIGGISYNSDISAYEINTADKLKDLAVYVNGSGVYSTSVSESTAHDCNGLVFKLSADISIDCSTAWDNAASNEHNFNAIGNSTTSFAGTFDGQNHTIRGIRIYKDGDNSADSYQGLFGNNSGTIQNVVLANARITGYKYIGGIAGNNTGTINACKVLNDVNIHTVVTSGCQRHGGISGATSGTISNCVSSVQITEDAGVTYSFNYGGITGYGQGLSNNFAYGVNISAYNPAFYKAAIIGQSSAYDYTNNYYIDCSIIDNSTNAKATAGIGRGGNGNITYNDYDGVQQVCKVTLADEYVSVATTATAITFNETNYYKKNSTFTLSHANRAQGIVFSEYRVTNDGTNSAVTVTNGSFEMGDYNVTAAAVYTIGWVGDGTEQTPYLIYERDQLDLLSTRVTNGVSNYSGEHFKLCADITYPHTSAWNDPSKQENNYTPIGDPGLDEHSKHFCGIFDGNNHMISGIRIFKDGMGPYDGHLGIFRYVDGGTVKNIILSNTHITGYNDVGGIVGQLIGDGKVQSCHVLDDVLIRAEDASASSHGGVVGASNFGSNCVIEYCSSSAQIAGPGNTGFGGIVGDGGGYVRNNLVIEASIDATTHTTGSSPNLVYYYGAISGDHDNENLYDKYKNNYYWNCKIGSSDINRARGSRGDNIFTNDGATPCFFITCGENVRTGDGSSTFTIPAHGNVAEKTYVFSVDQRYVDVFYDAPHDATTLNAVLAVTYTETDEIRPDLTENSTFQMPYGDITIRFKHYNLLKTIEPNKWYAISSPLHDNGQTYESISSVSNLATGIYDMFRYNESSMKWENRKESTGTAAGFSTLEAGRGYIYRFSGNDNVTLHYKGIDNEGAVQYEVTNTNSVPNGMRGFNLIGNPYPHQIYYGTAIPTAHLDANYYYSLDPNGCWHVRTSNEPIGIGEAVLVKADQTHIINFSDVTDPPAKNYCNSMKFTVSDGVNEDVAYAVMETSFEEKTGLPKIAHLDNELPSLSINLKNSNYAMAAIDAETSELPLHFSGKTGKYTISVEAMENADYLHLIDLQTGNDIDLLSNPTYTFTQSSNNTSAQGTRFLVKFSQDNSQLSTINSLFAYQSGDQTIITGTGTLQVFDVMGRQLLSTEVDSSPFSLHRSQFPATGVYILRLDGQTQKIVIK